jgi:hypothetical protein
VSSDCWLAWEIGTIMGATTAILMVKLIDWLRGRNRPRSGRLGSPRKPGEGKQG